MPKPKTKPPTCLCEGCKRKPKTRGLCSSHYQLLVYHVNEGHTTWDKAEASGACLPAQRKQKPFSQSFPMLAKGK